MLPRDQDTSKLVAQVCSLFLCLVCIIWVRLLEVGGCVMMVGGRTALLVVLRDQGSSKLGVLCMCVAVVVWGVVWRCGWVGWVLAHHTGCGAAGRTLQFTVHLTVQLAFTPLCQPLKILAGGASRSSTLPQGAHVKFVADSEPEILEMGPIMHQIKHQFPTSAGHPREVHGGQRA